MIFSGNRFRLALFLVVFLITVQAKDNDGEDKPLSAPKKKPIDWYSDADMERLLDEWNVSLMHFFKRMRC